MALLVLRLQMPKLQLGPMQTLGPQMVRQQTEELLMEGPLTEAVCLLSRPLILPATQLDPMLDLPARLALAVAAAAKVAVVVVMELVRMVPLAVKQVAPVVLLLTHSQMPSRSSVNTLSFQLRHPS
jgi:hypothetical protein